MSNIFITFFVALFVGLTNIQCPILIRTFSITKLIVDDSKSDKKGSLLQLLLKTKIEIWVKLPLLPYLMYHLWKLLIMMWWITLSL